jgi:hypothetical protein
MKPAGCRRRRAWRDVAATARRITVRHGDVFTLWQGGCPNSEAGAHLPRAASENTMTLLAGSSASDWAGHHEYSVVSLCTCSTL